jgi:hypothetical protein
VIDPNYTFSYVVGNLTINRAPLTVTTNGATINAGQPLPVFSGSNTLLPQDAGLITWSYAPVGYQGGLGNYPIVASYSDPDDRLANYTLTQIDGLFTVRPPLGSWLPGTVQINSQNPAFDPQITAQLAPLAQSIRVAALNEAALNEAAPSEPLQTAEQSGIAEASAAEYRRYMQKTFGDLHLGMSPTLQRQLGLAIAQ